jgi:energy-coupling factor transport system permease protein
VTGYGLYRPGRGTLHRLHPRSKASLVLAVLLLAFAPWQRLPWGLAWALLWPLTLLGLLAGLAWLGGRGLLSVWARRLLLVLGPLFLSLLLVQGFFFPGAREVLVAFGPLELKLEGLRFAAVVGGRLLVVVGAILLVTLSTHPADLVLALAEAGWPRELGYVILAALLLLPRLSAQAGDILEAQQARGLRLRAGLLGRARALVPLLGPLVLGALQEAQARAAVLDARAFRASGPKTRLRVLSDPPAERLGRRVLLVLSLLVFFASHGLMWGR